MDLVMSSVDNLVERNIPARGSGLLMIHGEGGEDLELGE